jgi:hypothetical protein
MRTPSVEETRLGDVGCVTTHCATGKQNMKYETNDKLISLVAEFRLAHHNLTDDDLNKLVKQTFRIDQATLREMDGVTDLNKTVIYCPL